MSLVQQLTLEAWDDLSTDDDHRRREVAEGSLVVVPQPQRRHNDAGFNLKTLLRQHLPSDVVLAQELEVLLQEEPLTIRVPDLVAIDAAHDATSSRARPEQVRLVVEIASPGSRHTDRVAKPREYAAAGIAEYWLVDLDAPSLACFRLGADGAYEQVAEHTGEAVAQACGVDVPLDVARLDQP